MSESDGGGATATAHSFASCHAPAMSLHILPPAWIGSIPTWDRQNQSQDLGQVESERQCNPMPSAVGLPQARLRHPWRTHTGCTERCAVGDKRVTVGGGGYTKRGQWYNISSDKACDPPGS